MFIKTFIKTFYCVIALILNIILSLSAMEAPLVGMQPVTNDHAQHDIARYLTTLPKIRECPGTSPAEQIGNFLCAFSCGEATHETPFKGEFIGKIARLLSTGQPLKLFIVGFSVKSTNPAKVLSPAPDLADYLGLLTLDYMCQQIETLYPAGVSLTIYQHELQLLSVQQVITPLGLNLFTQERMTAYITVIHELIARFFPHLRPTLENPGLEDPGIEAAYKNRFATHLAATGTTLPSSYPGLKHFFEEEIEYLGLSKTQKLKTAGIMAKAYITGANTLRETLQAHFPDYASYIRLSFRKPDDGNIVNKLGISLIHGFQGSPLHNTVGFDSDGIMAFDHCKPLSDNGYIRQTVFFDGIPLEYTVK